MLGIFYHPEKAPQSDMPDKISSEARSRLMGSVRRQGTAPELTLRKALWAAKLHYRLKAKTPLPGSPDIIFLGAKVAIFVDGCFWHGCPSHGSMPKTRTDFWKAKIARNQERDAQVDVKLTKLGWTVIRIWEHQIRDALPECVNLVRLAVSPQSISIGHMS